jgi:hypothetical protein
MVVSCSLERAKPASGVRADRRRTQAREQQIILLRKHALGRKKTIWLRTFTDDLSRVLFQAFPLHAVRIPE